MTIASAYFFTFIPLRIRLLMATVSSQNARLIYSRDTKQIAYQTLQIIAFQ